MKVTMRFELPKDHAQFETVAKAFQRQDMTHKLLQFVSRYCTALEDGSDVESPKHFSDHVFKRLLQMTE